MSVVKRYVLLNEGCSSRRDLEPVAHSVKASILLHSLLSIFVYIFYLFWRQSSTKCFSASLWLIRWSSMSLMLLISALESYGVHTQQDENNL